jgi:signal transduction histidine kinase
VLAFPFLLNAVSPYSGEEPGFASVLLLFVVVAALALGDSRRERGRAIAERDETRRAMQDTLENQAAMGERARIARDLHDIVAHHVSAIAVEAETARLTTKRLPKDASAHFEAIAQTARDALDEMRRLLGVLREDADGEFGRVPQPGLAQLDELIETARAAGSTVRVTMSGDDAKALPASVDLCAYRIVQEALSNARRHAPGATVDVEIAYGADSLGLRIRDDGPGAADADPDGHGLQGMRERATIAGGTLRAGPREDGGFAVEAELPVPS